MRHPLPRAGLIGVCILLACTTLLHAGNTYNEDFTTTTFKDAVNTTADWNTAAGVLRLPYFVPDSVGTYDTPSNAREVVIEGNLAFVVDYNSGLLILDITDPAVPTLVGSYNTTGTAEGVAIAGDLAFVADGAYGLLILDITNPASPVPVGALDTPDYAEGLTVAGDLAFVGDHSSGVQIIDISDPTTPVLAGTYPTPDWAFDVTVNGDIAYVPARTAGMLIIDITNPASPALLGTHPTEFAYDVAIHGDIALLAAGNSGLEVVDVTDPTSPTLIGNYGQYNCYGVNVSGHRAFLAALGLGLDIINISDPANPTLEGNYNTPSAALNVAIHGDLAFISDAASGVQISRFANRVGDPLMVSNTVRPLGFDMVEIVGSTAFVADDGVGLITFDISDPTNPLDGASILMAAIERFTVAGDMIFAADGEVQIVDISDPSNMVLAGTYSAPGLAHDVAVTGDLALVANGIDLRVLDISNPASPSLVGTAAMSANRIETAGDLAFVLWSYGVTVVDISDPATPTSIGSYLPPDVLYDLAVDGDYLFLGCATGLLILDIADPTTPALIGSTPTNDFAYGIDVAGDRVLVAALNQGITVVDITDPTSPFVSGSNSSFGNAIGIDVSGDLAYVASGPGGLHILEHQSTLDTGANTGQSLAVDATMDNISHVRLSTMQTGNVSWEISANGGTDWQSATSGVDWVPVSVSGSDLLWRSTHTLTTYGVNPSASSIQLEWLCEGAIIHAITDIPLDQGREVRVEWLRSGHDFLGDPSQITQYVVYRAVDPNLGSAVKSFDHLSPSVRDNARAMLASGWDYCTTVPARVDENYAAVVPTLADSTITNGQYYSTFRVTALTATPGVHFHSAPDSGYSVDNLAPETPANVAAAYNTGSGVALSWDESPDTDFQYFRVYRSTDPNFEPSALTLVHSTTTPGWTDPGHNAGGVYYKITATDYSGNESDAASPGTVTTVGGADAPQRYALYPNVPNPFNPTTVIHYDVPNPGGEVTLTIYDVSGRAVRTLVSGPQSAGAKSATWNGRNERGQPVASGVYFYRLIAPGFLKTHKMVLMK